MAVTDIALPPAAALPVHANLADFIALTKPRIVELLVVTGAATAVVAAGGWPGLQPLAAVVVGGGLAGAGAGSINCALEGELDRRMPRTCQRPVAAGRIPAPVALALGIAFNLVALLLIWAATNWLAAVLAVSGTIWYVFVYTLWLKPRTIHNIVVGGLAGSFPPLVGWAAVTGGVGVSALAFAAVIFLWTPPHFWALATLAERDYRQAGIPMLPVVAGHRRTARAMLGYAVATVAASVVPILSGDLGIVYAPAAIAAGAWLVGACHRHLRCPGTASARSVFVTSIGYLGLLFLAAALDSVLS
jgi:protoheme IX farnesyltransferase